MEIKIYSQTGTLKLTADPGESSQCTQELQGDSVLNLSFVSYEYVALDVNDYVDFCGERYFLTEFYRPVEASTVEWKYDVQFYGWPSLIKRYLVLEHTDGDTNPVFTLTAPALRHVGMIVECLNNATGTDVWRVGEVKETGNLTVDYFGKYCNEGLRDLAEKAGTEYWIHGTTVNLCRCEHGERLSLGYGNGLISLERGTADNAKFYTRLYPVGSTRNIDPERYGHTRLQLPGGAKYVDLDVERYGVVDHYEQDAFSGIYPRYTGTISEVRSEDRTDGDGNAFKVYFFKDASLPFDPNDYLLPGEAMRVSFQTGVMQGLGDTDDHYFEADYDSGTGEFEIINIWTDGEQLPYGELVPSVGDTYIPWNIGMPDAYYQLAEQEFQTAVDDYNLSQVADISVYRGGTDHVWVERNGVQFSIGRNVRLASLQYFPVSGYLDSRITKISRRVDLPTLAEIEISEATNGMALKELLEKMQADINGLSVRNIHTTRFEYIKEYLLVFCDSRGYPYNSVIPAHPGYVNIPLYPKVYHGEDDITASVAAWQWRKYLPDGTEDTGWSATHTQKDVTLTDQDMPTAWGRQNSVMFECIATLGDIEVAKTINFN